MIIWKIIERKDGINGNYKEVITLRNDDKINPTI
jgi:hypothetical protein